MSFQGWKECASRYTWWWLRKKEYWWCASGIPSCLTQVVSETLKSQLHICLWHPDVSYILAFWREAATEHTRVHVQGRPLRKDSEAWLMRTTHIVCGAVNSNIFLLWICGEGREVQKVFPLVFAVLLLRGEVCEVGVRCAVSTQEQGLDSF